MANRACRHCKSPARGNPCWWFIDHSLSSDQIKSGADWYAPCEDEMANDDSGLERHPGLVTMLICMALFVLIGLPIIMWIIA